LGIASIIPVVKGAKRKDLKHLLSALSL
jgi:hypothetical protein